MSLDDPDGREASFADLTISQQTDAALASDDPAVVSRLYVDVRSHLNKVREAVADIETHLHAVMEGHDLKRYEVPGTGVLETGRKVKRTGWKHDDLLGDLARASAENRRLGSDGELEPAEWVMARLVADCVSLGAGKVTGIRRHLPHDVDEYCTVGEAEPFVSLKRFDR